MGSYTTLVYTAEQQARLGVDEYGTKVTSSTLVTASTPITVSAPLTYTQPVTLNAPTTFAAPATLSAPITISTPVTASAPVTLNAPRTVQAMGPAWLHGEIERPAGEKDMGGWTAAVYTAEQQVHLGVDEFGQRVASRAAGAEPQGSAPAPEDRPITKAYAAALLGSPNLLATLCRKYFKKYDTNDNGLMELSEVLALSQELHEGLGVPYVGSEDRSLLEQSIAAFNTDGRPDSLSADEFPAWFATLLQDTLQQANGDLLAELPPDVAGDIELFVKTLGGREEVIQAPLVSTVADLRVAVASLIEAAVPQTYMAVGDVVLLQDDARLYEYGLQSGMEVTAVVVNTLQVKRHVYQAHGGAPPHRGYHLTATDEVELEPDLPLREQWQALVPSDGYPGGPDPHGPIVRVFQSQPEPPATWEDWGDEVNPDAAALEVFGLHMNVEVAVMLPMRGMD